VITDTLNYDDEFSFWIPDGMLAHPLPNKSQIRLHLINTFRNDQIISARHRNQIKLIDFKELLRRINELTFGFAVDELV
jgi:hypothetical protein